MAPQGVKPNLRVLQLESTRRAIQRAAIDLFARRGFGNVTTAEIADAVGVTPRTFFRHFPGGKNEVLIVVERRVLDLLCERVVQRPPDEPPFVAIRRAMRSVWDDAGPGSADASASADMMTAARIYAEIASGHAELLALLVGDRHLRGRRLIDHLALRMSVDPQTDLRPALIAQAVMAALTVAWIAWIEDPSRNYRHTVDEALDLLEHGLGTG
jgi:AcrR family transcriptional regulator